MAYLLDANAFIEAKKRWYGFDFCPAHSVSSSCSSCVGSLNAARRLP